MKLYIENCTLVDIYIYIYIYIYMYVVVLWLILHSDYKIGLIFKRFLFNEKIALLNELLFISLLVFFPSGA